MQSNILSKLNTNIQLKNINFLEETCQQLNKDLNGLSSSIVQLTAQLLGNPLNELIAQLELIILDLEKHQKLSQFMYQLDLKEVIYMNYKTKSITNENFYYLIIERAAQKVFLRWHFKLLSE